MKKISYLIVFTAFIACENKEIESIDSTDTLDFNVSMDNSFFTKTTETAETTETRSISNDNPTLTPLSERKQGILKIKWKEKNASDYTNSLNYVYDLHFLKWKLDSPIAKPLALEPYKSYDFDIIYTYKDPVVPNIQNTGERFQANDDLECQIHDFILNKDNKALSIILRHSKMILSYNYDTSSLTGDKTYDEHFKGSEIGSINGIIPYVTQINNTTKNYQVLVDKNKIVDGKVEIVINISKDSGLLTENGTFKQTQYLKNISNNYYYEYNLIHTIKITASTITNAIEYDKTSPVNTFNVN
jgi:hypothetical protein